MSPAFTLDSARANVIANCRKLLSHCPDYVHEVRLGSRDGLPALHITLKDTASDYMLDSIKVVLSKDHAVLVDPENPRCLIAKTALKLSESGAFMSNALSLLATTITAIKDQPT